MNGGTPYFSSFGSNIYASDIVLQSIRCKSNEFKKLDPRHIKKTAEGQSVITDSSIARVLRRPNAYMSTADFLEKITILLELNKNVFIYPEYYMTKGGERHYTALYPLKPSEVSYLTNDKGDMFINMRFANGYEVTLPADSVIHWRKDYGVNDYFGGGIFGGNDTRGLLTSLELYNDLTQSIATALKVSCKINGVVVSNSYLDDDELKEDRKKFEKDLKENESGVLFTDNKIEYIPMSRDIKIVDAETLKFVYDTILRANGCSLAILNGDYTKAQKEAYYEHALEADIISLGQAFSRCIFSEREASYGNAIICYPNAITFMSMENKIEYMKIAVPAGALSKNQILAFGGLPPVEGGDAMPRGFNNLDGENNNNDSTGGADNE